METATEKPSLKDRVLAHKREIVWGVSVVSASVMGAMINNKIRTFIVNADAETVLDVIERQGKFLTPEIDGVQYVIHKYTPKS